MILVVMPYLEDVSGSIGVEILQVPTLSQWGLLLLTLALMAVAVSALRRHR